MRQQMQVTNLNLRVNREPDASVARSHGGLHGDRHRGHAVHLRVGLSAAGVEPERIGASAARSATRSSAAYPSWTFGVAARLPARQSGPEAAVAQNQLPSTSRSSACSSSRPRSCARSAKPRAKCRRATSACRRQKPRCRPPNSSSTPRNGDSTWVSSSFEVQQNQRDLASARQNNLQAKIRTTCALISLNAVQKIAQ